MKIFSPLRNGLGRVKRTLGRRQADALPLAQRLGYGPDARLLIVHADDLGLTRSVNASFINGLRLGGNNSGSAMVPCPEFPGIVDFARQQPDADIGLHLTLTSESSDRRWASVAPARQVPSLVDRQGFLHVRWTGDMIIVPAEVEIEIRAQIEKALAAGLAPTHIDSHQYKLQKAGEKLFEVYLRVSRDYDLPLLVSREWFAQYPYIQALLGPADILLDQVRMIGPGIKPEQWPAFYRQVLERLPLGVSEILIHPAFDDEETRAFFSDREDWGAAWRQRDHDFFASPDFREVLESQAIKMITWRDIKLKLRKAG